MRALGFARARARGAGGRRWPAIARVRRFFLVACVAFVYGPPRGAVCFLFGPASWLMLTLTLAGWGAPPQLPTEALGHRPNASATAAQRSVSRRLQSAHKNEPQASDAPSTSNVPSTSRASDDSDASAIPSSPKKHRARDVILMIADDLRPETACTEVMGTTSGKLHTPHICSFAEESLKLTRFHVGFAECAPSRASMLTSRQPQTTHVWDLYSCEHQPQSQPRPLSLLTGVRAPAATRLETQRRELHDATAVLQGARLHHEGHWQDLPLGSGLWQGGSCRVRHGLGRRVLSKQCHMRPVPG